MFLAASLVLLAHSRFDTIDVYFGNIARLLCQNWEQACEHQ
jgi:hypothetical protein